MSGVFIVVFYRYFAIFPQGANTMYGTRLQSTTPFCLHVCLSIKDVLHINVLYLNKTVSISYICMNNYLVKVHGL